MKSLPAVMVDTTQAAQETDVTLKMILKGLERQNTLQEKQNALLSELSTVLARQCPTSATEEQPAINKAVTTSAEPRTVFVKMVVERVFDLDTVEQTFGVQVFVVLHWKLPSGENPPEAHEDDGDWTPLWSPKFRLMSIVEEVFVREQYTVVAFMGETMVKAEIRHLVRIHELLELTSFPFDCQDLHIAIESKMTTDQVHWRPHPNYQPTISRMLSSASLKGTYVKAHFHEAAMLVSQNCVLDDFRLVDEMPYTARTYVQDVGDRKMPGLEVVVKAVRRSQYYLFNVAVFMFIIVSLAFCAWSLHPADLDGRLSIDFALILTAIAFKVILNEMLPNTGYITRLEIYVMLCWLTLTGITVCHTMLPHIRYTKIQMSSLTLPPLDMEDEQILIDQDMLACWIFLGGWLAFNLVFAVALKLAAMREYERFWQDAKKAQTEYDKAFIGADLRTVHEDASPVRKITWQTL